MAGIQYGKGPIDKYTQRVNLATKSPGVVTLSSILTNVSSTDVTDGSIYITTGSIHDKAQEIDSILGTVYATESSIYTTQGSILTENQAQNAVLGTIDVTISSMDVTQASIYSAVSSIYDPQVSTYFCSWADATVRSIKASAGNLYQLEASNPDQSNDTFIQVFDVGSSTVGVGTTTPKQSYLVPAGAGGKSGAMDKLFNVPIGFNTAISYAITTEATGNTSPGTGCVVNALYK